MARGKAEGGGVDTTGGDVGWRNRLGAHRGAEVCGSCLRHFHRLGLFDCDLSKSMEMAQARTTNFSRHSGGGGGVCLSSCPSPAAVAAALLLMQEEEEEEEEEERTFRG